MSEAITLQLAQRGVLTLPKSVRDRYDLNPGDFITLLDLDGVLVLSPRRSEVDLLADKITQALAENGETLESMLQTLREERERYA
jgi:bifunctional DNA-binding transcriptional regulator/antitoxin component of YhaV-PrlF toxin-antitoxin module